MNVKYIQELLSRINEVRAINKKIEIDGVVCNIAAMVQYGQKLHLIILEFDEVYRQKVEEMELSEPCRVGKEETNRHVLKGRGRIEAVQPFRTVNSVFIDEMEFKVNFTENRILDYKDGESVIFLSELLRKGWKPAGVDYQNIDMLFVTSIEFEGDYDEIPRFDDNVNLHFTMNKDVISYLVEEPVTLEVDGVYPDKLWFKSEEDNKKHWALINRVYLMDIWDEMKKSFENPKLLEHMTKDQVEEAKRNIEKRFIDLCPKGMCYPVVEYESEEDISLEFHTKKFLDSKPVHQGNGSIGFMISPDKKTGILGKKLKSAIIQEPVSEDTVIMEAELFRYYKTISHKEISIC